MRIAALLSLLLVLASCKVMTLEEDRLARQRKSETLDANAYVEAIWASKVLPYAEAEAHSLDALASALDASTDDALAQLGRQASLGGPWATVIEINGTIESIDVQSRQGVMTVRSDSGQMVNIGLGPALFGSDIRDALPFFNFNDFANQIVYADVANGLTARALQGVDNVRDQLVVGDNVKVIASTSVRRGDTIPTLTPIAIAAQL